MTKRELKCKVNARKLKRKAHRNRRYDGHKTTVKYVKSKGRESISSTKLGAGFCGTPRKNLDMTALHKRNHRSNEMMGPQLV